MYKGTCLHPQLARIMAETGHTDLLCVGDAGLPVPKETERVDLAWKQGEPAWLDVCRMLHDEMAIEKIYLAEEMKEKNPEMLAQFLEIFRGVPVAYITHAELKEASKTARAVIRTGEFSPFCNCLLVAGVNF